MVSTCDFDSQNSSSILLPPATYKPLVYAGVTYTQFLIDTDGNILNTKTNKIYKKSFRKRNGYLYAYLPLGKRGKVKAIRIHKAVAETFIPNPLKLEFVNHIDEDRTNCNISNLEWVTAKENTNKHLALHPTTNNRKLSKEDVEEILQSTLSKRQLAKKFNVSKTTIHNVINRDNYYTCYKQQLNHSVGSNPTSPANLL